MRYHALDIFVATEYRRSSCAYRAILSHEKDHVRIAREYLGRFVPRFEEALRSRNLPTPNRPQFTKKGPGEVVKLQLAELVEPVFEELNAEMARAQAALDTPQRYARVQSRCDDW